MRSFAAHPGTACDPLTSRRATVRGARGPPGTRRSFHYRRSRAQNVPWRILCKSNNARRFRGLFAACGERQLTTFQPFADTRPWIPDATVRVSGPRSFSNTRPSLVVMNVLTPDDRYSIGYATNATSVML